MLSWFIIRLCLAIPPTPSPTVAPPPEFPNMQLPNEAWSQVAGEVVRPVEGGLWYARTSALVPVGSVLSIRRNGVIVNGAWVMEADKKGIFLRPWAADAIQPGDELRLQSVAPKPPR